MDGYYCFTPVPLQIMAAVPGAESHSQVNPVAENCIVQLAPVSGHELLQLLSTVFCVNVGLAGLQPQVRAAPLWINVHWQEAGMLWLQAIVEPAVSRVTA
jgi:hypothetical protein